MDADLKVHHRAPWDGQRGAFTVERGMDQVGTLRYRRDPDALVIEDTQIEDDLHGHGAGAAMVRAAAAYAHEAHLALRAECPWAAAYLRDHAL